VVGLADDAPVVDLLDAAPVVDLLDAAPVVTAPELLVRTDWKVNVPNMLLAHWEGDSPKYE